MVIGNPPYLGGRDWKDGTKIYGEYFARNYETIEYQFDMYVAFWERAIKLTNKNGYVSFITPNTWLNNQKTAALRRYILNNTAVVAITDYSKQNVFEDAVVLTIIATLKIGAPDMMHSASIYLPNISTAISPELIHIIQQSHWFKDALAIINIDLKEDDRIIREKIEAQGVALEDLAEVKFGVKIYETGKGTPPQKATDAPNAVFESNRKLDETYRRFISGRDINNFEIIWENKWLKYGPNLAAPRNSALFDGERILVRRIVGQRLISTHTNEDFVTSQLLQIVKPYEQNSAKFILAVINSSLMAYYFRKKYNRQDKTFPEIRIYELASLPIKVAEEQQPFIDLAEQLLVGHHALHAADADLGALLRAELGLAAPLSGKLAPTQPWKPWSTALEKSIARPLSLKEKAEWLRHFEAHQQAQAVARQHLAQLDTALDALVYQLYRLTPAEIALVEGTALP